MALFRLAFIVFFIAFFGSGLTLNSEATGTLERNSQEQRPVQFRWAFCARIMSEKEPCMVSIERDTVLKSGDQLKIFLELQKKCYIYLIYYSAQRKVHLLFPFDLDNFPSDSDATKDYCIPKGDAWFELDGHTGTETFYLLASAERLVGLEALVKKYEALPPPEKGDCKDQILTEIRSLKRQHQQFKTAAERPVLIVGGIRGSDETRKAVRFDPALMAIEISAERFYSKTFTIDYQ